MELSIIEKASDHSYDLLSNDDNDVLNTLETIKSTDCSYLTEGIRELSSQFRLIKVLVIFILLNPFIRIILTLANKKYFNNEAFDTLLTKDEKFYINLFTLLILILLNGVIILMLHDYTIRAIMFFLNNIYLLVFAIQIYRENKTLNNSYLFN
jgi:hypothetical protein